MYKLVLCVNLKSHVAHMLYGWTFTHLTAVHLFFSNKIINSVQIMIQVSLSGVIHRKIEVTFLMIVYQ